MVAMSNKVVLITGAGGGIGRAIAVAMARQGAAIVSTDIDQERGPETAQIIRDSGGNGSYHSLDVRVEDEWVRCIAAVEAEYGRLDVLVNNAGVCAPMSIFKSDHHAWRWHLDVELDGRFLGCKHAIPLIAKSEGGSVINIASSSARVGAPGLAAYATAKAGVCGLSKSVAADCVAAGYAVRVNTILPGGTQTPIWVKMAYGGVLPAEGAPDYDHIIAEHTSKLSQINPLRRPGYPEDIADTAVFLASTEARYINCMEVVVDGGSSAIRANPSVPKE